MTRRLLAFASLLACLAASVPAAAATPMAATADSPTCAAAYCVPAAWGSGAQAGGVTSGFYKAGQVFAPLFTGALTEVQLGLWSLGADNAVAEIRPVAGGVPTATILASAVVPGAPYSDLQLHVASFAGQHVVLASGVQYALVVRSSGESPIAVLGAFPECRSATTGTLHFVDTYDFGATWGILNDRSFVYRICLDAATATRPRSWGDLKLHYR